jgi:hypothetical protein
MSPVKCFRRIIDGRHGRQLLLYTLQKGERTLHHHGRISQLRFLLTVFLDELAELETCGLEHPDCLLVRNTLRQLVSEIEIHPGGSLLRDELPRWLAIEDHYHRWNDQSTETDRKFHLNAMRSEKRKIKNQYSRWPIPSIVDETAAGFYRKCFTTMARLEPVVRQQPRPVKVPKLTRRFVRYIMRSGVEPPLLPEPEKRRSRAFPRTIEVAERMATS